MLDALRACTYPNLEVLVVDNGSRGDESARWDYHYPGALAINPSVNLGLAGGTNLGIRRASGNLILLLANDTLVEATFLEPMVALLIAHARVGMVSPKIARAEPPGTLEYAGAFTGEPTLSRSEKIGYLEPDEGQYDDVRDTEVPYGACVLVRRELFEVENAGPLPEFYYLYFDPRDFAARAHRLGYGVMYCGRAEVRIARRRGLAVGPGDRREGDSPHGDGAVRTWGMTSRVSAVGLHAYYHAVESLLKLLRCLSKRRRDPARQA